MFREETFFMDYFLTCRLVIRLDATTIKDQMDKIWSKRTESLKIDEDCLRWTPLISCHAVIEEERKAEIEVQN